MTRVMREFCSPEIHHDEVAPGLVRLTALRLMNDALTHVRVTHAAFPHTFVIPLSETLTITQMHVPVDDEHTYWYSFFTSFAGPLDKETMRAQRLAHITLPDYVPKNGRHNQWNFNPEEQRTRTFLGMGDEDINLHDQWAVESMGPIQDRTREHLGTSDKVIMAWRRTLLKAIETVQAGGTPPWCWPPMKPLRCRGRTPWTASRRPRAGRPSGKRPQRPSVPARPGWRQAQPRARPRHPPAKCPAPHEPGPPLRRAQPGA